MSTGRILMSLGLILGAAVALLSAVLSGGAINWLLHAPTAHLALPLSVALLASGAVVRRQERAQLERDRLHDLVTKL